MIVRAFEFGRSLAFDSKNTTLVMCLIMMVEVLLNGLILYKVPYTEIDWKAYMSEVEGYLNGSTNYYELKGDTGPLVYPGGFVYLFSVLYWLTDQGINIARAQIIFAFLYLVHLAVVFAVYRRLTGVKMPPLLLCFISLTGYRIHSIFALRLFNDGPAMTFFYLAMLAFINQHWKMGSMLYSLSVSIKMNTLLAAPGLLIVYLRNLNMKHTIINLAICAAVQVITGFEFLTTYPVAYLHRSFNLGRQFEYKWTVNWRLLSEELFLDRRLHVALLLLHLAILVLFCRRHWLQRSGDYFYQKVTKLLTSAGTSPTSPTELASILMTSNFIGLCFARSLHYQFYVWYYHSLPLLFYHVGGLSLLPSIGCLLLIEYCWNVYPSTVTSSSLLLLVHMIILAKMYTKKRTSKKLKKEN